jgi:hypothetical protein
MQKKIFLIACFLLCLQLANAQMSKVSGNVQDTATHLKVKDAVVAFLTPKDSVLKGFARVKEDGSWSVSNIKPGKYIVSVTHPLFADFVDDIEVTKPAEVLSNIALTPKSKLLEAVIVKSGNPIRLKGDTTIYTADSFKVSANANVEELLKKMPGIQVDKNGTIKAMGETVEKVLVDGEEFFGDDPGMAVKNLRADAVKEVQVFDKKSDQAEFTGIDDGKTQKTINLKLKDDRKKGYFGKIDGAGGLQNDIADRYNTNIMLSSFKGKRKVSGFLLTGNTGQDGLSWQDEQKYGGGDDNMTMSMDDDGGMMYMWRGGNEEEAYLDPSNGYIKNVNAGLQYSNKWNDKTTLNLSPKFNSQDYTNHQQMYSQQLGNGDSALTQMTNTTTNIDRYNFKMRGVYDVKIDSFNTLKLTGNTNYYHTESEESNSNQNSLANGKLISSSNRTLAIDNDKTALSGNLIFKHKFKKLRRTLSLTTDWKNVNTDGTNFLKSANNFISAGTTQLIDQKTDINKSTSDVTAKLTYTEPLSKKYSLEVGYQFGVNHGTNDQMSYGMNTATGKYEIAIDSLTNNFRQNITQQTPSAKINYNFKKLKWNIGTGVSFTDFQLTDITRNKNYDRTYSNFFPTATLNYSYKSNHNLRFTYSGTTRQPTISQLQPLTDNQDPFNKYIGNPDLKPSFSNRFNVNHNTYNFIKDIWTYQGFNINLTDNSITNNTVTNYQTGVTTSQSINTDGNISMSFWGGGGFKAKKLDTRFNINPNVSYNKYANFLNGVKSFSKNLNTGISVWVSKSKEKKYDLSIGNDFSHVNNKTTTSDTKIKYFTNTLSLNATVYYKKVWSVISDYQYYVRQKTAQVAAFDNSLWNARLQRTFKSDEFTAYVTIRDILNQNKGIDRNFSDNKFTETRNDRLQRYWMIGFAWNFKNKSATAAK